MKRNLEEQKIRQWFREARRAEAASAPSFEAMLAAARLTHHRAGRHSNRWRVAYAAIGLAAIAVAAFVFFTRSTPPLDQEIARPLKMPGLPPANVTPSRPVSAAPPALHSRPGRAPAPRRKSPATRRQPDLEPAALLSFKWQSPTDFLLRTPGADLLKTVPRVGDSLIRLDPIHTDQKN